MVSNGCLVIHFYDQWGTFPVIHQSTRVFLCWGCGLADLLHHPFVGYLPLRDLLKRKAGPAAPGHRNGHQTSGWCGAEIHGWCGWCSVYVCFNVPSSENCIIIWIFRFQGLKPLINGTSMVLLLAVIFWHSGGSDSGYCTKHHFSKFGGWLWARVGAALFSGFVFPDIEGVAVGYRTPKKMPCSKYGNWTHIAFEGAFML